MHFNAVMREMNRYSYSGSLNTEQCPSTDSTFTLQPTPALLFHDLINATWICAGTDIPVESQTDGLADSLADGSFVALSLEAFVPQLDRRTQCPAGLAAKGSAVKPEGKKDEKEWSVSPIICSLSVNCIDTSLASFVPLKLQHQQ